MRRHNKAKKSSFVFRNCPGENVFKCVSEYIFFVKKLTNTHKQQTKSQKRKKPYKKSKEKRRKKMLLGTFSKENLNCWGSFSQATLFYYFSLQTRKSKAICFSTIERAVRVVL